MHVELDEKAGAEKGLDVVTAWRTGQGCTVVGLLAVADCMVGASWRHSGLVDPIPYCIPGVNVVWGNCGFLGSHRNCPIGLSERQLLANAVIDTARRELDLNVVLEKNAAF